MQNPMDLQKNRLLREYSTFGIGGPSRCFLEIRTIEQAEEIMIFCRKQQMRYFILGKGSNCLFSDQGFDGLVILNKIDFFESMKPGVFHVGAGYSYSLLGTKT